MLAVARLLIRALELLLGLPIRAVRALLFVLTTRPNFGPLRHVISFAIGYLVFALALVYVVAPLRGLVGQYFLADKLRYDAERWLATAVYDTGGSFVGTFDPRLDSQRDVNYTDAAIALGSYVANPDHKSIPVRVVPQHYWQCLVYHEDRHIGGLLNPYGIDLVGVLKIPLTTLTRSIALKRPSLGIGGSTLPMQFVRVIYNTPPSPDEGGGTKLKRKLKEWWLAPVIYHELTRGGNATPLKQWAANHIWLAQRTGGAPLHGVEITSRVVFGKDAKDLSVAEQFVLASAVNKPIILLPGSDKLNEVRIDRWRYIAEVRARVCAEQLIADPAEQKRVIFELINLAGGPPDPRVKPKLQEALEAHAPALAQRALANPMIRANALMPAARFGLREEMKQAYGFGWREHVRGVTTTLDVVENLSFHERIKGQLAKLDAQYQSKIGAGYTLDPAKVLVPGADRKMPDVVVVAANSRGEIVRYFEAGETASYFGSPAARSSASGTYDAEREGRMIASTGKILAAIAIANAQRDRADTLYLDRAAPARGGLEGCEKGSGETVRGRRAIVAFACSLNQPIEWRAAQLGQARVRRLIDRFGFNLPPSRSEDEATPPSTAAVRGLIAGSPRRVHQMAGVVLASLTEQGHRAVRPPTLVKAYDFTTPEAVASVGAAGPDSIVPNRLISDPARPLLKALLQAPLCYAHAGVPQGTLKAISSWCPDRRTDLKLHFAKTGTSVGIDSNATVDTWIAGGLQFGNGAAYSYLVLVGTGSPSQSWARSLHAGQVGVPLLETLLADLKEHARKHGVPAAQQSPPVAAGARSDAKSEPLWRERIFQTN
jgi:membrane peptidoglycan carboxypeptidase